MALGVMPGICQYAYFTHILDSDVNVCQCMSWFGSLELPLGTSVAGQISQLSMWYKFKTCDDFLTWKPCQVPANHPSSRKMPWKLSEKSWCKTPVSMAFILGHSYMESGWSGGYIAFETHPFTNLWIFPLLHEWWWTHILHPYSCINTRKPNWNDPWLTNVCFDCFPPIHWDSRHERVNNDPRNNHQKISTSMLSSGPDVAAWKEHAIWTWSF